MLLTGGAIGFVAALFLVAGPGALALAEIAGTAAVWPLQGVPVPLSPSFAAGLLVQLVVVSALYAVAAIATPSTRAIVATGAVEELCRGAQIGLNACANALYAAALYPAAALAFGVPDGGAIASALVCFSGVIGVVNLLCVFPALTRNFAFETTLGWSSWLMPMSWPLQVIGFVAFLVGAAASLLGRPFVALTSWWPGVVVRHGWLVDFNGAFTIGNFTIVGGSLRRASPTIVRTPGGDRFRFGTALGIVAHEIGHTLVAAAFGSMFTAVGFVHERMLAFVAPGYEGGAYFEVLCEGVRRLSGRGAGVARPWIDMWAPRAALAGPNGGNAAAVARARVGGVPARAGAIVSVALATPVELDASASADPDDFPMGAVGGSVPSVGFRWALTERPHGSQATILGPTSAKAAFTPDVAGRYVIVLAVSDGAEGESLTVEAFATPGGAPRRAGRSPVDS